MNSVLIAVMLVLLLAVLRVHVVLALLIGAVVGGVISGLGFTDTMVTFQEGLGGGATIALSYALLGAFAMAVASAGLPKLLADWMVRRIAGGSTAAGLDGELTWAQKRAATVTEYGLIAGILAMAVMSQNLIPVHIAFIPLLIPPLLRVMNTLRMDRRLVACVLTFGLVTTYMFLPIGFGRIYLESILMGNISTAGLDTTGINVMSAMWIPALGMVAGLLTAVFISYRRPRVYEDIPIADEVRDSSSRDSSDGSGSGEISRYKIIVSVIAILACFIIQLVINAMEVDADSLLTGALVGLAIFMASGAVKWNEADDVFTAGMRMMALIGFIMITAQGFAAVMTETGDIPALVESAANLFGGNRPAAALAILVVGLVVTMGIGSSFSTLPIITAIYVPLCMSMGFSPLATISIIGTAGALGDAGSPASDSTLGPTSGLNADGQHDHIRDTVIPTFIHYNLPLLAAGWIAAMVL
ncbi:Na+/H+ antiporter family protein [Corynebacterium antarcticum]|uniref:Na+/H+ antiporter family protein n=1 Tax=Corynebacterium antarcticum TaxID=2800405 RepID=UPI002004916A|nr:Na+/H+ antiporter NhaC family protein [Corynebacterium antarcticum]MCK7641334.1 TRAP transporter large permease subunit [Corynebacterium antarcticum]MCX7490935.1 TRAP transporter large permease subunit [Corynebacterium antarcticum]MCX7539878.1 TRAP transporter large permease subunit [Corynebacterium antarcticum]